MKALLESLLDNEDIIIDKFNRDDEIKKWLESNCEVAGEYTINKDYTIDIRGSIYIHDIENIPVNLFTFNKVSDTFSIESDKLTSLNGTPMVCHRFSINHCTKLKTLDNIRLKRCNYFTCSHCYDLISLKGLPDSITYRIQCRYCKSLKSLKGAPKKCEVFICDYCDSLISLEGIPICDDISCQNCKSLKSLKGAPKECNFFTCYGCKNLKSLEGAPKKCLQFDCEECGKEFTKEEINQYLDESIIRKSIK